MSKPRFGWRKLIAIWVCFLLLHFSYGWFPEIIFRLVSESNETVFLHTKMLFLAAPTAPLLYDTTGIEGLIPR